MRIPKLVLATVREHAFMSTRRTPTQERQQPDKAKEKQRNNNFLFTSRQLLGAALILLNIDFPHMIMVE